MTENEAIKEIKRWSGILFSVGNQCVMDTEEAQELAITALKEIQQYREIGTVEECREAVEKQEPKRPIDADEDYGFFICPVCRKTIYASDDFESHKFCLNCGQAINWKESEEE